MSEAPVTAIIGGIEHTSVVVARSRPFAAMCLAVWRERDGRQRAHMMNYRSFWVPSDIIEAARARLEAKAAKAG